MTDLVNQPTVSAQLPGILPASIRRLADQLSKRGWQLSLALCGAQWQMCLVVNQTRLHWRQMELPSTMAAVITTQLSEIVGVEIRHRPAAPNQLPPGHQTAWILEWNEPGKASVSELWLDVYPMVG